MAESTVNEILQLIMQQGEIEANRIKEEARWQEEIKRAKNAWKRNTLKAIATIGPMFIPGLGPFGSLLAGGIGNTVSGGLLPSRQTTPDFTSFMPGS